MFCCLKSASQAPPAVGRALAIPLASHLLREDRVFPKVYRFLYSQYLLHYVKLFNPMRILTGQCICNVYWRGINKQCTFLGGEVSCPLYLFNFKCRYSNPTYDHIIGSQYGGVFRPYEEKVSYRIHCD
jgi:hypothetical protein